MNRISKLARTAVAGTALTLGMISGAQAQVVGGIPGIILPPPPPLFELFDSKTLPGNHCRAYYGSKTGDFRHYASKLYNAATGTRRVICPVLRDNTTNTNGTFGTDQVYVYAYNPTGSTFYCAAYSYGTHGQWQASDSASTRASGRITLRMDLKKSANMGTYSIYCRMPSRSSLYGYKWLEPLRTDRNN